MNFVRELSANIGIAPACLTLCIPRASFYRYSRPSKPVAPRPPPPRALSAHERAHILDILHCERFADKAPAEIWATLLDNGTYLCSQRTMYRILEKANEVRERRNQLRHPHYKKPQLLATAPNQVWSWDITKLPGPAKWTYFYLYVILDIFSRYTVGWMIAERESATLANQLISETCAKQNIAPGQLTLHADRGASMRSKPVALLLSDLGVTKTHSRPHTSDDNPFSESQFRTLKYRPEFPDRFGSLADARAFARSFFAWHNMEHRHSGIALLTPHTVHYDHAASVLEKRQQLLQGAFLAHPERFVAKPPTHIPLPTAVWINPPKIEPDEVRAVAL
jgi:putative transposase